MIPIRQTESIIKAIAASLRPTTLAAVIEDLMENDQVSEYDQELADYAAMQFGRQLSAMVGERQAARLLNGEPGDLETCDCGCEGVAILHENGKCDVCNGVT